MTTTEIIKRSVYTTNRSSADQHTCTADVRSSKGSVNARPTGFCSGHEALNRLGATTGAVLLSFGLAALMGLLFFAPAIAAVAGAILNGQGALLVLAALLAFIASVVLVLWFVLRFILTAQVTAAEPLSAWGIFRRTGALSSGRIGPRRPPS